MNVRKKEKLSKEIVNAFYSDPPPLLSDDAASYKDYFDDTFIFWGKDWHELKLQYFENNPTVFSSLPSDILPYFLGAYMYLSVKEEDFSCSALVNVCENPILARNKKYRRRPKMQIIREALSDKQIKVFTKYLSLRKEYVDPGEESTLDYSARLLEK